jgi:hypothetical protein
MGGPITPEARAMIDEAVRATVDEFRDDGTLEEYLRSYIKRRWPFILKAVITSASTQP